MAVSFIKLNKSVSLDWLLTKPNALAVCILIARRARPFGWPESDGLKAGEAKMGDYKSVGCSRQQYRTALAVLKAADLITTRSTTNGLIASLSGTRICDISKLTGNQQSNQQATSTATTGATEDQPAEQPALQPPQDFGLDTANIDASGDSQNGSNQHCNHRSNRRSTSRATSTATTKKNIDKNVLKNKEAVQCRTGEAFTDDHLEAAFQKLNHHHTMRGLSREMFLTALKSGQPVDLIQAVEDCCMSADGEAEGVKNFFHYWRGFCVRQKDMEVGVRKLKKTAPRRFSQTASEDTPAQRMLARQTERTAAKLKKTAAAAGGAA